MAFVIYPFKQEADEVRINAKHTMDELQQELDLVFRIDNDALIDHFELEHPNGPYSFINNEIVDALRCLILNSKGKGSFWNLGKSIEELKGLYQIHTCYEPIVQDAPFSEKSMNQKIIAKVLYRLKKLSEDERVFGLNLLLEVPASFSVMKISRLISDLKHRFDSESLIRLTIKKNQDP